MIFVIKTNRQLAQTVATGHALSEGATIRVRLFGKYEIPHFYMEVSLNLILVGKVLSLGRNINHACAEHIYRCYNMLVF